MKLLKIIIKDYQQFKHLELDFTHPETGEPLDKVCFIGRNATGKSTILWIVWEFLNQSINFKNGGFCAFKILNDSKSYYSVYFNNQNLWFSSEIEELSDWIDLLMSNNVFSYLYTEVNPILSNEIFKFRKYLLKNKLLIIAATKLRNTSDLLIFSPTDDDSNSLFEDVPNTTINESLELFKKINVSNIVSNDTIKDFWKLLVFHIKQREDLFREFQEQNENLSYKEAKEKFGNKNPDILTGINIYWNKILANANLYFDVENAKKPIQLTDNLKVYIKYIPTNEVIPYNKLSSGIRNFIFKIGHIRSLYFNRKIERGFLLVDEPENSLFPDFLYDLIDEIYLNIIKDKDEMMKTQFFFATHNPIIATQFEPYERIILDFDESSYVVARKGTVPVGDDPNDILYKDFGMRSIYTKAGVKKWERYLELKVLIKHTTDETEKDKLIVEFSKLGREYNFPSK